jgi:hypothetical protein
MKIEEKELGARPHRMVELYALMEKNWDKYLIFLFYNFCSKNLILK